MQANRRRPTRFLLAVMVLVAAAGCSAVSSPNAAPSGDTTGINDSAITIAVSSPESGAGAFAAAYGAGLKAYLEYVNDQGGINGYTFDVVIVDNQGTAAGGAQAMRQILQRDPFFTAITGSSSFQASVEIIQAEEPELPVLGFGNAAIIRGANLPNAYGYFPDYTRECFFQVEFAMNELGAERLALAYEDSAIGQGPAAECPGYADGAGVAEFESYAVPPPTVSTNYTSIAAQIQEQDPDAVLFFGSNTELVGIQQALFGIGHSVPWIGLATSFDDTFFELAGEAGEGTYFDAFVQTLASDTPEVNLFKEEVGTRAPNAANTLGGHGWSYGAILELAVRTATDGGAALTRESFIAAMNSIDTTTIGLLHAADYTGSDRSTIVTSVNVYQATDGAFVLVAEKLAIPELQ